ncbi:hypothetical protein DBR06_SOUSAS40910003, partial [Sousa chinensis]
ESVCIEIRVFNPEEKIIHLDVQLSSAAVSGLKELVLFPLDSLNCVVRYSPATTGYREQRYGLIQPIIVIKFVKLSLNNFTTFVLPSRFVTQIIPLDNPTHETLELQATNSNPDNFVLEINRSQLIIPPHSTKDISVHFRPSALGGAGHQTSVTFHCAQFKEWIFYISAIGLFPQPLEIERMTTYLRLQSSVLIPFQNPTEEDVLINIILIGQGKHKCLVLAPYWDSFLVETSAFKLSGLSHTKGTGFLP